MIFDHLACLKFRRRDAKFVTTPLLLSLLLSMIVLNTLSGSQSWAGMCQSALGAQLNPSQIRLKTQWKMLDDLKKNPNSKVKKQNDRVLREVMAVWSEMGIAYEFDPDNNHVLLVSIPNDQELKTAHPLNRMARSMAQKFSVQINGVNMGKTLRIEVNPLMLKQNNAGALFDENQARLTLAIDNVLQGKVNDMVTHESRHAYNFYKFANGADHRFAVWISTDPSLPIIHETYPHQFSADEISTYAKQIVLQIKYGLSGKTDYENPLDFTKTALLLIKTITHPQSLKQAIASIQDLQKNPKNWLAGRWTEAQIENENQKIYQIKNKNPNIQISIYENALLPAQQNDVPIKVSHVVVEHGLYKTDIVMRESISDLNSNKRGLLLEHALQKIMDLYKSSAVIEKSFLEVEKNLEKNDGNAALKAIHSALMEIGI